MDKMNSGRYSARHEEEILARKRNAELLHRAHWDDVTKYFQAWDIRANKFGSWTCSDFYNSSSRDWRKEKENKKRKENVIERREKLALLLDEENKEYTQELKRLEKTVSGSSLALKSLSLNQLQNLNVEMKMKEQEARRREAELKRYHQWKLNTPFVTGIREKQLIEDKTVKQTEEALEKNNIASSELDDNDTFLGSFSSRPF